jgi:hypothetical protein
MDFLGKAGPSLVTFWLTAKGEVADLSVFDH